MRPQPDISELATRWSEQDPSGRGTRREVILETLRSSCKKQEVPGQGRPTELDLRAIDLSGEDLAELDLSQCDLSEANLSGADLTGSNLSWTQLRAARLVGAQLTGCELLGADLSAASLNECRAERAGFGGANLTDASLIDAQLKDATMSKSRLCRADFRAATLQGSRITEADLTEADFTRADLRNADLKLSNVFKARFDLADLQGARLMGISNFRNTSWIGADIRGLDLRGACVVARAIRDENYLYEFRSRSKRHAILYWIWRITSDCGRSLPRWSLSVGVVILVFAFAYSKVGIDYGAHETLFSPLYYSVVTMTTLGYGDVTPTSLAGQILAGTQALLGYLGLGGLLSIFATKMARRAD